MNPNQPSNSLEDSFLAWENITDCLERFASCWDSYLQSRREPTPPASARPHATDPSEPDIVDFIPRLTPELTHVALVELVKLDLDYRWPAPPGSGEVPPRQSLDLKRVELEEYLARFPRLLWDGRPPVDLVYEAFHVRKRSGERISMEEIQSRFPEQATALERLIELGNHECSTSLFKAKQPPPFQEGDRVDDFDLLTRLGRGAFATVYLARQTSLQRLVALKISADQGDEPQTLAQLDHPHIVRVYDQRVLPDRGCRLLYMQYMPGGTLADAIQFIRQIDRQQLDGASLVRAVDLHLDQQGQAAPAESNNRDWLLSASWEEAVCRLGIQLAGALQYAHDQGVLHRDLKPANVLLTAEASPRLVDFNISFCSKLDGANPGAYFGGSLAYMSPEQLAACDPANPASPQTLGPASDLYALAVLLWEIYFGTRPFADLKLQGSWSQTLAAQLESRHRGPADLDARQLASPSSRAIHQVLLACLTFEPSQRVSTGEGLQQALRLCAQPAVKAILQPEGNRWIRLMQHHPLVTLILLAMLPNLAATVFNIYFNGQYAIPQLSSSNLDPPAVQAKFTTLYLFTNGVVYALGFYLIFWRSLPLLRATRWPERCFDSPSNPVAIDRLRRQGLRLGSLVATVCIVLWSIAGVVYPLALQVWGVPTWPLGYLHFISAHVVSGMIAGAYPFLAISWFGVRCIYPRLSTQPGVDLKDDQAPLAELSQRSWFWMACALLLPLLAVVLMVLFSQSGQGPLAILCISSLLGCLFFVWGTRRLQISLWTLIGFYRE